MAKTLIRGARIANPGQKRLRESDLLMEDGKIGKIRKGLTAKGATVIDAAGKIILPGFIDIHAHFRDPGREDEENILSGSQAALAGGYTGVAIMANSNPVLDNLSVLQYINDKAKKCKIEIYPVAAQTVGLKGECLTEMVELAENGAIAFSDDGKCVQNSRVMRRLMEYSLMVDKPLIIHAEDKDLSLNGMINEGYYSTLLGLRGIPSTAEIAIIARDLSLAELIKGVKLHFTHLSTARSVELIRQAKRRGMQVTCDVTPHHLVLTEEALVSFDSTYKVNPPLRTEGDRNALIEGLIDGTIDAIGTDHAPHALHEKEREFDYAPFGMIGLETAFPVLYSELVLKGVISLNLLVERLTTGPANVIGLKKDIVKEKATVDLILIDADSEHRIEPEKFYSKSQNCPFKDWMVRGKVTDVFKGRNHLVERGRLK